MGCLHFARFCSSVFPSFPFVWHRCKELLAATSLSNKRHRRDESRWSESICDSILGCFDAVPTTEVPVIVSGQRRQNDRDVKTYLKATGYGWLGRFKVEPETVHVEPMKKRCHGKTIRDGQKEKGEHWKHLPIQYGWTHPNLRFCFPHICSSGEPNIQSPNILNKICDGLPCINIWVISWEIKNLSFSK